VPGPVRVLLAACKKDYEMNVNIKLTPGGKLPRYMSDSASGLDCYASHPAIVPAHSRVLIELGFSIALPPGYEAQVRPRSGMALREGVYACLGTVDADYRGEVKCLLINTTYFQVKVETGDRVCQLVIAPVVRAYLIEVNSLDDTARGDRGFGHTGVK
jgi:dUTP pyrophosphatase